MENKEANGYNMECIDAWKVFANTPFNIVKRCYKEEEVVDGNCRGGDIGDGIIYLLYIFGLFRVSEVLLDFFTHNHKHWCVN